MKNQKGITIISLIITIIVMVILAGIALAFSVGENGVITKAEETKTVQSNAEELERLSLAIVNAKTSNLSSLNGDPEFDEVLIKQAIEKEFGTGSCDVEKVSDYFVVTIKDTNNKYKVTVDGKVEKITGNEESSEDDEIIGDVSIAGSYGFLGDSEGRDFDYYLFNEDESTGSYMEYKQNPKKFTYTMSDGKNGILKFENGETQNFVFEVKSNNKVIYIINLWGDNTNVAYTTNGAESLSKINKDKYEVYEEGEYMGEAIFDNKMLRIEYINEWVDDYAQDYFVKDNYLYLLMSGEDVPNYYFTCYKIEGNKLISLMS